MAFIAYKFCKVCETEKAIEEFPKNRLVCKKCRCKQSVEYIKSNRSKYTQYMKEYYKNHPEKRKSRDDKYRENNKEKVEEYSLIYRRKNADKLKKYSLNWNKANKERHSASKAKRRARLLEAMPKWADNDIIISIYKEAILRSKTEGIQYDVDHIIPLQGKNVCGLHVHTNLQILLSDDNRRKSNKFLQE
jgi:hypothetical protein